MSLDAADFAPANALERLLVDAAQDKPGARAAFDPAFLDAEIFAISEGVEDADAVEAGAEVRLRTVPSPGGAPGVALFTSLERIEEVIAEEVSCVSARGRDLLAMVEDTPVVLNPGSPYGRAFTPDEIGQILAQAALRDLPAGTKVLRGEPREVPTELLESLRRVYGADSATEAAWLSLMFTPAKQAFCWGVHVRTDAGRAHAQHLLVEALKGVDTRGFPVDLHVTAAGGEAGAGLVVVEPR